MQPDHPYPPFRFALEYITRQGLSADGITWTQLGGDGSDRVLYRVACPSQSFILAINENPPANDHGINENDSFVYICNHLRNKGFAPPAIHAFQRERGWFLLEDLGDVRLLDQALALKEHPAELEALYQKVLSLLATMQVKAAAGFDTGKIHSAPYDKTFVRRWESGYFLNFFVKAFRGCIITEEALLTQELDSLAERLAAVEASFFLYRDFQSKNIMISQGELRLIDFQGARRGPLHYDLASLLLDPYVDLGEDLREKLFDYYLQQLSTHLPVHRELFLDDYRFIAVHRSMQILGAFAYLHLVKGKSYFASFIPAAVKNLKHLFRHPCFAPYGTVGKVVLSL